MNPDSVTNCQRCNSILERGYSSRYIDNKCIEVICFTCDKKETMEDYLKDKIITTRILMDSMLEVYRHVDGDIENEKKLTDLLFKSQGDESLTAKIEIQIASAKIQKKIKEFESKIWFNGLQEQVLKTKCRGVSAKLKTHNKFCVLTWTCAGRTMITIEDNDSSVTCVADETSKDSRTGFHGIRAKASDALDLIDLAIELYENKTLKFKDDDKVGMI